MPEPKKGESKKKFIPRCISYLYHEDSEVLNSEDKKNKQAYAICNSIYDRKRKKKKKKNENLITNFQEFLNENLDDSDYFHVSKSKNRKDILENGIKIGKSALGIYVWDSYAMAKWFADLSSDDEDNDNHDIFEVDISGYDLIKDDETNDMSYHSSEFKKGEDGGGWIITNTKIIPPDRIELYESDINCNESLITEAKKVKFEIPEKIRDRYIAEGDLSNVKNWRCPKTFFKSCFRDECKHQEPMIGYVLISLDTNHIIPVALNDDHHTGYELLYEILYKKYKIEHENYIPIYALGNTYVYDYNNPKENKYWQDMMKKYLSYGGDKKLTVNIRQDRNAPGDYKMSAEVFAKLGIGYNKYSEYIKKNKILPQDAQKLVDSLTDLALMWREYDKLKTEVGFNKTIETKIKNITDKFIKTVEDIDFLLFLAHTKFTDDVKNKFARKMKDANDSFDMEKIGNVIFTHNGLKNYIHLRLKNEPNSPDLIEFFNDTELALEEFNKISAI